MSSLKHNQGHNEQLEICQKKDTLTSGKKDGESGKEEPKNHSFTTEHFSPYDCQDATSITTQCPTELQERSSS